MMVLRRIRRRSVHGRVGATGVRRPARRLYPAVWIAALLIASSVVLAAPAGATARPARSTLATTSSAATTYPGCTTSGAGGGLTKTCGTTMQFCAQADPSNTEAGPLGAGTYGAAKNGSLGNIFACGPMPGPGDGPADKPFDDDGFQCVELANRFLWDLWHKLPISDDTPGVSNLDGETFVQNVVNAGEAQQSQVIENGTAGQPYLPGDIISFSGNSQDPPGHVAVVIKSGYAPSDGGNYTITIEQENATATPGQGTQVLTVGAPSHVPSGMHWTSEPAWTLEPPRTLTGGLSDVSPTEFLALNVPSLLTGAEDIGVGNGTSCTTLVGGRVVCWGQNAYGALGDGSTGSAGPHTSSCSGSYPCATVPTQVTGLTDATSVASGGVSGCALRSTGTIVCWGDTTLGELGNGTTSGSASCFENGSDSCDVAPVAVQGISNASQVSVGRISACAVLKDGTIWCWGDNTVGELGDGAIGGISDVPVEVVGIADATSVSVADEYACATLSTGEVNCWGWDDGGQLGDGGTESESGSPVTVAGISNAQSVSAGEGDSACAVLVGGAIDCWGQNQLGELGIDSLTPGYTDTPLQVSGSLNATQVAAGDIFACALTVQSTADCWGRDDVGQLGLGTLKSSSPDCGVSCSLAPSAVVKLKGATAISANDPACALLATGSVDCWGDGELGGLGDGKTVNSDVPVAVLAPRTAS
jgi:alpha-tubulin suppressor-like RCC1 family protein